MNKWLVLIVAMSLVGCKTISVRVNSADENINLRVPFAMVKSAVSFSNGSVSIEDLAGVDQEIDLRAIARALKQDGDKVRIEVTEEDTHMLGKMEGNVFSIKMQAPDEKVTLNLPMSLVHKIAETDRGETLTGRDFMRALRKHKGVLVQVESEDETVKISIN